MPHLRYRNNRRFLRTVNCPICPRQSSRNVKTNAAHHRIKSNRYPAGIPTPLAPLKNSKKYRRRRKVSSFAPYYLSLYVWVSVIGTMVSKVIFVSACPLYSENSLFSTNAGK